MENLLRNPEFESNMEGWGTHHDVGDLDATTIQGKNSLRIRVRSNESVGFPEAVQHFEVHSGDILHASALVRAASMSDGKGPYLSFSFFGKEPGRLSFTQSSSIHDRNSWVELELVSVVPEEATRASLCLLLHGHGEAYFSDPFFGIEPGGWEESGASTGNLIREENRSFDLIGFGGEDDGWFYNRENLGTGYSQSDVMLREERLRDLDPDWVRMFIWYQDWNPSGDWETYDFETDNMKSRYRCLDLYQSIGARVNVVGVEWGVKDPYGNPNKAAHAIGALLEHLIVDRGYTCIRDWTLSNEPNHYFPRTGYTFEEYKKIHRLVSKEFETRGLNIRIVGSDDAEDFSWFSKCIRDEAYRETIGLLASHRYFKDLDRYLAPHFFEQRTELVTQLDLDLPLTVAEFGFQDSRSGTFDNPIMKTYDYALWTASFAIEGLNRGFSGFTIWTLHEMNYPSGRRMMYGLWDDRENDWNLRPVYYAWRNFCRLTDAGDRVIPCSLGPFKRVKGVQIGATLFWVNESPNQKQIDFKGYSIDQGLYWNEEIVNAQNLEGREVPIEGDQAVLPSRSFGFFQVEE
ncbi:MAG: hypothetical protein KC931_02205 [Candidatus Omnitrophica bacterium]|nr:hypothetical protein [Candidatus Omnitrophota bacterium]